MVDLRCVQKVKRRKKTKQGASSRVGKRKETILYGKDGSIDGDYHALYRVKYLLNTSDM